MAVGNAQSVLTAEQRDALFAAYRAGYYEIPRRTTIRRLARERGVPPSAFSRLLREAESVLAHAFVEGDARRSA